MEQQLQRWIIEILQAHPTVMNVALRQRAKFEGWLKFELAAAAAENGASEVVIEAGYDAGRADLSFQYRGDTYYIEMKTPNTNWRIIGIESKHRPITKNISAVAGDAEKLKSCPGRGILVFVLFPIPQHDIRWRHYLQRIADGARLAADWRSHCSQVSLTLSDGSVTDVVIVCIDVQANGINALVGAGASK